jgi:hypothetical protein
MFKTDTYQLLHHYVSVYDKKWTVLTIEFINAQQVKLVNIYKNTKAKLRKTIATVGVIRYVDMSVYDK